MLVPETVSFKKADMVLLCVRVSRCLQTGYTDLKWTNLTENANGQVAGFVDWDWAQTGCLKAGNCSDMGLPDTSIFATMYAKPGDWDTSWDPDVHLVRSDDFFKTIKKRVACGNQFELMGRQVRSQLDEQQLSTPTVLGVGLGMTSRGLELNTIKGQQ